MSMGFMRYLELRDVTTDNVKAADPLWVGGFAAVREILISLTL